MEFKFSKHHLNDSERKIQRFLEIVPGFLSWSFILGLTALSIFLPFLAAMLMIMLTLYWLIRLLYMTLFLTLSYMRLDVEKGTNWMERIHGIDQLEAYMERLKTMTQEKRQWFSFYMHKKELEKLKTSSKFPPLSKDIYHLVIYPVVKENRDILEPGIVSLLKQTFPPKQILFVFALEDRANPEIKNAVKALEQKYKDQFFDLLTIIHPSGIAGEARVKGANVTCAARAAQQNLEGKNIPLSNVVVSCFDADTVVGPEYFSCLTYHFMVYPDRLKASFQPIPVYHNNIWQVPGFARVVETGSSFFQLIEATNPEKLVTFSSHSMSFKALVDVDFWPVDMISDDSAIFWKAYIHYDGDYQVIPMYVTLSMDVVSADTWLSTIKSVYKQKRRWAWGVENFPIVTRAFLRSQKISLYEKFRHGFKLLEGHISWATWGFILSIIVWLPILFMKKQYSHWVIYYNLPQITNTIFSLSSLCLMISIILSILLLPKHSPQYTFWKKVGYLLEWLMIPLILLVLTALPALDAQTRLMRGKYLEFWVTDKKRKT